MRFYSNPMQNHQVSSLMDWPLHMLMNVQASAGDIDKNYNHD